MFIIINWHWIHTFEAALYRKSVKNRRKTFFSKPQIRKNSRNIIPANFREMVILRKFAKINPREMCNALIREN